MAFRTLVFLATALLLATTAVNTVAIKECISLPPPKDGDVQSALSKSGQQLAIYMCNEGFTAVGDTILSCVDGQWDKIPPFCASLEHCELTPPDALVQINDPAQKCLKLTSPRNGRMDTTLIAGLRQRATFSCKRGYKIIGPHTIYCEQGRWQGDVPACEPEDCGKPEAPENGSVFFEDTHFKAQASYECNDCFIRQGAEVRRCRQSGNWSESTPECVPDTEARGCTLSDLEVSIGVQIINRRALQAGELTCGQTVQIQCFTGFQLGGSDTAVCKSNGEFEWIGAEPSCTYVGRG